MQIFPAIDLKDNKCVRLSKGKDDTSVVFNDNPIEQASYFENTGCKRLHIVDLDAAFGRPNINFKTISKIKKSISIPIQLGGGIRRLNDAIKYFKLGIEYLIIGSLAVKDPETVIELSNTFKEKIYVSLDISNQKIMIKGWEEKSKYKIDDILKIYKNSNIKGYVLTDIANDGMLNGLDVDFITSSLKKLTEIDNNKKKLIVAGGLSNYKDLYKLKTLKNNNLEGIISGKSFYVGNIDLNKAQNILDQNA